MSRRQLLQLGLGARAVGRLIEQRRLHPVHQGVYAVGHRVLGPHGRWMAAVLAGGDEAVLSHRSAAEAWDILPRHANERVPKASPPIHISVPGTAGRARPGITIHRLRLDAADVDRLDEIRISTPSRTLIDLAAGARDDRFVERALDEARYRRLLDIDDLRAGMGRARYGVGRLERVLSGHVPGETRTASTLEERFLALMRLAGLPQPLCNQRIGRLTVDFLWPDQRLVVEVDGAAFHSSPDRRRRDRLRDASLRRRGYRVLRFLDADIAGAADAVVAAVVAALAATSSSSS